MSYTTNFQLEKKAKQLRLPLVGVFSKDELPKIPAPGYYIINLQDETNSSGGMNEGTHWVGVGIDSNPAKAVYWDSYGVAPPIEVQEFLKPFVPYQYSTKMIQNPRSGWCGYYQLFFIAFMHQNSQRIPNYYERFRCFLQLWNTDYEKNLEKLKSLMKRIDRKF
jgi:hypothetical protein